MHFLPFTDFLKIVDLESAELLMGRRNFPTKKSQQKKAIHQKKIIK
jgi:hypothetical protein